MPRGHGPAARHQGQSSAPCRPSGRRKPQPHFKLPHLEMGEVPGLHLSAPCVAAWKLAILSSRNPYSPESPREIQAPTGLSQSHALLKPMPHKPFSLQPQRKKGLHPESLPLFRALSCQASALYLGFSCLSHTGCPSRTSLSHPSGGLVLRLLIGRVSLTTTSCA